MSTTTLVVVLNWLNSIFSFRCYYSKVQLIRPPNIKTCPLLRPPKIKTGPLLRPPKIKTGPLLRQPKIKTGPLLRQPYFSPNHLAAT